MVTPNRLLSALSFSAVVALSGTSVALAQPTEELAQPLDLNSSHLASTSKQDALLSSVPEPGTAKTSATDLMTQSETELVSQSASANDSSVLAQTTIDPGRPTRSSRSYIGIGGNVGIARGSTDVGEGAFVVLSKIGLTEVISARPAVFFGDDVTFLIPITYDFYPKATIANEYRVAPYLGGGLAITTRSGDSISALLTAGVDVPIGSQFTATAALNLTLFNDTDFGLMIGVGYNFR
jgi:hypothetical protein